MCVCVCVCVYSSSSAPVNTDLTVGEALECLSVRMMRMKRMWLIGHLGFSAPSGITVPQACRPEGTRSVSGRNWHL